MNLCKKITIIGSGQAGSILAYRFIKYGYQVRIIEAGTVDNRPNRQVPWGWWRKRTLQPKVRMDFTDQIGTPFDTFNAFNVFNDIPFKAEQKYGPMLISTKKRSQIKTWLEWIKYNQTDAHILCGGRAKEKFGLTNLGSGGVLVCDSQDFIINFNSLNCELYEYLRDHPNCELIENFPVENVTPNPDKTVSIQSKDQTIVADKVILAAGNQNSKIIDNYPPIVLMKLPYMVATTTQTLPYIALWNQNSCLTMFGKDNVKVGCGSGFTFDDLDFKNIPFFGSLFWKGLKKGKVCVFSSPEKLMDNAKRELEDIAYLKYPETDQFETCSVDLTPSFLPIVDFFAPNLMVIGGFSGSGFTAYEKWFGQSIIQSIEKDKMVPRLESFGRHKSLYQHWCPKDDEKSYVFQ